MTKVLHILLSVMAVVFFCFQSYTALTSNITQTKSRTMIAHSIYGVLILSGLIMVIPILQEAGVSLHWLWAKAVLLLAVMSSSVKAFRPTANQAQRKMGILIASIGLIGIIILGVIQPDNLF